MKHSRTSQLLSFLLYSLVIVVAIYLVIATHFLLSHAKTNVIITTDVSGQLKLNQQCINGHVFEYVQNQQLLPVYKMNTYQPLMCDGRIIK